MEHVCVKNVALFFLKYIILFYAVVQAYITPTPYTKITKDDSIV
jgi:hypothetical protein